MAGIYLHIPFCRRACHYCDFHFATSLRYKNDLVQALLKEIFLQKNYLDQESIETIYFGGGTPSLLEKEELLQIMDALRRQYSISGDAEITLEVNPDDINPGLLQFWAGAGINRLSIGVQSFFDTDLLWMNRVHNARQAAGSIRAAQDTGFQNISIDLIYGTPLLEDARWLQNLEQAVSLNIPHLSCYALTVEPKTFLSKMIARRKTAPIDPEKQARQFLLLQEKLESSGYEAYEISNYARQGMRSRHNSSYWQGKKYLGLGPSAHSFDGESRQWNISNNTAYIRSMVEGKPDFEKETLSGKQKLNEYIMTSLRTREGIDLRKITRDFGEKELHLLLKKAEIHLTNGKLTGSGSGLLLSKEGKLFADGIAADLFV